MGQSFSCFITPTELADVVHRWCAVEGWTLWHIASTSDDRPLVAVDTLAEAQQGLVYIGPMPAGRREWNARAAGLECGFAGLALPRLIDDGVPRQLIVSDLFTVSPSRSRRLPHGRLKAEIARRALGTTVAVDDESCATSRCGFRYTAGAFELLQAGAIWRQVADGPVHFLPAG